MFFRKCEMDYDSVAKRIAIDCQAGLIRKGYRLDKGAFYLRWEISVTLPATLSF